MPLPLLLPPQAAAPLDDNDRFNPTWYLYWGVLRDYAATGAGIVRYGLHQDRQRLDTQNLPDGALFYEVDTLDLFQWRTSPRVEWVPLSAANPMTTLGDTTYGGIAGVLTRLPGDTSDTRKFLGELSVTGVATAPQWDTLTVADIGPLASASFLATALTTTLAPSNLRIGGAVVPAGVWILGVEAEVTATGTNNLTVTVTWQTPAGNTRTLTLGPSGMGTLVDLTLSRQIHTDGATDVVFSTTVAGGAGGTYSLDVTLTRIA